MRDYYVKEETRVFAPVRIQHLDGRTTVVQHAPEVVFVVYRDAEWLYVADTLNGAVSFLQTWRKGSAS